MVYKISKNSSGRAITKHYLDYPSARDKLLKLREEDQKYNYFHVYRKDRRKTGYTSMWRLHGLWEIIQM